MNFTSKRVRVALISFIALLFALVPLCTVSQETAKAQNGYVLDQNHKYISSIDGATLPCSVYFPAPNQVQEPAPLWVNLHAFGGHGEIEVPPEEAQGWFVLSPWGRNYKSMYGDGKEVGDPEPCVFDNLEGEDVHPPALAPGWSEESGDWRTVDNGVTLYYQQFNSDDSFHVVRHDQTEGGTDYTASVDIMELSAQNDNYSGMGIMFRRQVTGEGYLVGLFDLPEKGKKLCLWRDDGGSEPVLLSEADLSWSEDTIYNLKVNVFEDVIEVSIASPESNYVHKLVALPNSVDDSWLGRYNDATYTSGGVGLFSLGGVHLFDNFRVQNEFLYGETDILDCIYQFMEEVDGLSSDPDYRVDPTRIYLSGYSMGGVGTWNIGLHYPDLFSALHPRLAGIL